MNRFYEITSDITFAGFEFSILIDDIEFEVRNYDHLPGTAVVTGPKSALILPQSRQLVDYLTSCLRRHTLYFYDEQSDRYRTVELSTLEFKREPQTSLPREFVSIKANSSDKFQTWPLTPATVVSATVGL